MSEELARARSVAIKALNECHEKHGMKKIMDCDFCSSLASEMTIARHYEFAFQTIKELEAVVDKLLDSISLCSGSCGNGIEELIQTHIKQHATKEDNDK